MIHADIYSSIDQIVTEFNDLVLSLTSQDHLVCSLDCSRVKQLVSSWKENAKCQITTYGEDEEADNRLLNYKPGEQNTATALVDGRKVKLQS